VAQELLVEEMMVNFSYGRKKKLTVEKKKEMGGGGGCYYCWWEDELVEEVWVIVGHDLSEVRVAEITVEREGRDKTGDRKKN